MAHIIPEIYLGKAKNAQHDEFMKDVLQNAQTCAAIATYIPGSLAAFKAAAEAEHALISRPLRWEITPLITAKDAERDKALTGLRYAMWAAVRSPEAQVSAAADVVLRMSEIDKITGGEQYDEETGKISEMLTTLTVDYSALVLEAGLKPYVDLLKRLNDEFCELLQVRDAAQGEAGPRDTEAARVRTDAAYRKLVLDVNSVANCIDLGLIAGVAGGAENPFAAFIDYMNGIIERYKREILRSGSSASGSGTGEDSEVIEEEVTEEETEGGSGSGGSGGSNGGGSGSTGSENGGSGGSGSDSTESGSGSTGGNNPGSGSGTGIPIQPGPGGDDPDL